MARDIIIFLVVFFTPGLLILVFARRMVEYNARSYPRIYGPVMRMFALILFYVIGVMWLSGGVMYLIGR
jgi:hypothetical protein